MRVLFSPDNLEAKAVKRLNIVWLGLELKVLLFFFFFLFFKL